MSSHKVCVGNIPKGTTEAFIRIECAKYGAVSSVFYTEECGDGKGWAVITFPSPDMAAAAYQAMQKQLTLFGSMEKPVICFGSNNAGQPASLLKLEEEHRGKVPGYMIPDQAPPSQGFDKRKSRSRSGRRKDRDRKRSRSRRRRSRSRSRKRDRSRSRRRKASRSRDK